jgi:hypothetical protein
MMPNQWIDNVQVGEASDINWSPSSVSCGRRSAGQDPTIFGKDTVTS